MKKRTKIGLGAVLLTLGTLTLSGCNSSFCTVNDQAHILYAFDQGTSLFLNKEDSNAKLDSLNSGRTEAGLPLLTFDELFFKVESVSNLVEGAEIYQYTSYSNSPFLSKTIGELVANNLRAPGQSELEYFRRLDLEVLKTSMAVYCSTHEGEIGNATALNDLIVKPFGYVRFADFEFDADGKYVSDKNTILLTNYSYFDSVVRKSLSIENCPTQDFLNAYISSATQTALGVRTCLTTVTGNYGGEEQYHIEAKTWGDAWGQGFFEGLLIYPIGALTDVIWHGMTNGGLPLGIASILSIIIVTFIARTILLAVSFKSTAGNAKMTELQPEIQKIQNKYPNAQTNNYEKQRMAEEMQKLYKKNGINPLSTLLVMVVQFPLFICVWNALSNSAALSTGTFCGMSLTSTISTTLFDASSWVVNPEGFIPGLTALILFLLMAIGQTAAMLIPQWMQKAKAKKVAKLGKNPSANSQANQMKIFTYVMLAMIIFMGFSLASAMGVYWFIGAIYSIAQTLITQAITSKKSKRK